MTESQAVAALKRAGVETAVRDAQILWAEAAGDAARFAAMIARRAQREPVSHILQRRAFYAHDFIVTPDVLDPRPDTETLVDEARRAPFDTVLDLGTGSGCILLSLLALAPQAVGVGADISAKALDVARRNAAQIGVADRVQLIESDWFSNVAGRFDLIVSNPPYITAQAFDGLAAEVKTYEPKIALTPGGDGLASYRIIAAQAAPFLTRDGALMLEIGFDQGASVSAILSQAGWGEIRVIPDLNGKDRVVTARLR